jgi:hypothetical protein
MITNGQSIITMHHSSIPPLTGKISSLSLSPTYAGERVGVRGHLTDIFLYHPSLPLCGIPYSAIYAKQCGTLSSPLKGRGIAGNYFLNKR